MYSKYTAHISSNRSHFLMAGFLVYCKYKVTKNGYIGQSLRLLCTLSMKRRRARVTIEGQCVLLQIYLRIKMFDFFKQAKLPYETHLCTHTSEPLKKL